MVGSGEEGDEVSWVLSSVSYIRSSYTPCLYAVSSYAVCPLRVRTLRYIIRTQYYTVTHASKLGPQGESKG